MSSIHYTTSSFIIYFILKLVSSVEYSQVICVVNHHNKILSCKYTKYDQQFVGIKNFGK